MIVTFDRDGILVSRREGGVEVAETTAETELGNRARAERAFAGIDSPGVRLPNKDSRFRWGEIEGFSVIRAVSGAVYLIDSTSGAFYRTVSPGINRIMADSPSGVFKADRDWLIPLLDTIPGGKACVQRYHPVPAAPPAPPARAFEDHRVVAARDPALASIKKVVQEKRVTVVEKTETIDLGAHQVVALLRLSGEVVPDTVALTITPEGYVRVSWSKGTETIEESGS